MSCVRDSKVIVSRVNEKSLGNMFANRIVYKIGLQAACEENSPVHGVGEVLEAVYKALHSKFETQQGMLRQVHALSPRVSCFSKIVLLRRRFPPVQAEAVD